MNMQNNRAIPTPQLPDKEPIVIGKPPMPNNSTSYLDNNSYNSFLKSNAPASTFATDTTNVSPNDKLSVPTVTPTDDQLKSAMDDATKVMEETAQANQALKPISSLASYIRTKFSRMRSAKQDVTDSLNAAALQRAGKYDDAKLSDIKKMNGADIFMNITSCKCRAVEAWIREIFSEDIYDIRPTAIPEVNPDLKAFIEKTISEEILSDPNVIQYVPNPKDLIDHVKLKVSEKLKQETNESTRLMKDKINDYLEESGWYNALHELISDLVTYKAGILKGPMLRKKNQTVWSQNTDGSWVPTVKPKLVMEYESVSPFDIYFSAKARKIETAEIIQRHQLCRQDLVNLIGVVGYDEASIRAAVTAYSSGYKESLLSGDDTQRDDAEGREDNGEESEDIDALEYWGNAPGKILLDWGVSPKDITDPDAEYQINAWVIGNYVIKAVVNKNPGSRKPYYITSFENINGSIWGRGVPELLEDIQRMCNALARAIVDNAAMSSGPQAVVDLGRIDASCDTSSVYPRKLWYVDTKASGYGNNASEPIKFFQPELRAELMALYNQFEQKADNYLGVPAYTYGVGSNTGGVGRTATGFNMLMANAAKGIKFVISNMDKNIIEPSIEALYEYIMINDPDNSIKGDIKIVAKGSSSLVAKEQMRMSRIELLNITSNPVDMQIMGLKGRSNLLRDVISATYLDPSQIIPDEEEFNIQDKLNKQQAEQAAQMQLQQSSPQGMPPVNNGDVASLPATTPNGEPTNGQDVAQYINKPGMRVAG